MELTSNSPSAMTATELRRNVYQTLDRVLETGMPQEIVRNGRKLMIVSKEARRSFENAPKREVMNCSFDELVETSWENSWNQDP